MSPLKVLLVVAFGVWARPSLAATCELGHEAYINSVYPKIRKDCAKCHDGTRPTAPPFATTDSKASYELVLNYMNFSKIQDSLFVIRAGNGHCASDRCGDVSGAEMLALTQKWHSTGESSCMRNGRHFTEEIPVPFPLPKVEEGFLTVSMSLSEISPSLDGLKIALDIQDFSEASDGNPGAYRIKAPRLVSDRSPETLKSSAVRIKDMKVLLNGKYDPIYNAFTTVDKSTKFFNLDSGSENISPMLSGHYIILLKDGIQNPKLSVSFVEVGVAEKNMDCKNIRSFSENVLPKLRNLNCVTCHGGPQSFGTSNSNLGQRVFNLTWPEPKVCQVAQTYIEENFLMSSPLVALPVRGSFGHPQVPSSERAAYLSAVRSWITESHE